MKADNLFQMLADVRTEAEKSIRELLDGLGIKKLNVNYYVENYEVENTGFSAYDSNAYSSPAWLESVEILEDGDIEIILNGDWECETYLGDMVVNEAVIVLDILEQCEYCIKNEGAEIVSE